MPPFASIYILRLPLISTNNLILNEGRPLQNYIVEVSVFAKGGHSIGKLLRAVENNII